MKNSSSTNSDWLQAELRCLRETILQQGKAYSKSKEPGLPWPGIIDVGWPGLDKAHVYPRIFHDWQAQLAPEHWVPARLILSLAMATYVQPQLLDILGAADEKGREFTEYGRFRNDFNGAFLPTVQTALFILAGTDLGLRFRLNQLLLPGSPLVDCGLIQLESHPNCKDLLFQRICIPPRWLHRLCSGEDYLPEFGPGFPATQVKTKLDWADLVLSDSSRFQLREINHWLSHYEELAADPVLGKRIRRGYRVLFHGPPGTGKTLTAGLLGKEAGLPVFRVDLSMVVSKYIGETEKNLARLFREAEGQQWILFFDEADSLFGKRTQTQSSHDKYANQEVSFLLQRIEDHPGLVILASNFRSNIDEAFLRRFQSVVHFPAPKMKERLTLWKKAIPKNFPIATEIDLEKVARKFDVTGAHIVNIMQTATLLTLAEGKSEISEKVFRHSLSKEYEKEERHLEW